MEERAYQEECIRSIIDSYHAGFRQLLAVLATGTGKTVIFSKLIGIVKHFLPGKALVFAHREELIDQAVESIRRANPDLKVGKEMADFYADIDCDVVVSCVASIGRSGSDRLSRFGSFSFVVCDEAHHSIASTYLNVFTSTGVLEPGTDKLLLGFTATPKRKNRKRSNPKVKTLDEDDILSLKSVYQKIAYTYPIRKAIKEGWLVPLKGYRLKTDVDLSDIKSTGGDYQQDELADTVNTPKRNAQILKAWLEWAQGRQTVGFTVDIEHAKALSGVFRAAGVKAEAVWGSDPQRAEKLAAHKSKEITVLFNAQVLTEGYDDWQVSCIILAAPSKSSTKYTQEVGRGTRLQTGIGNLLRAIEQGYALSKLDCLILDVVDNNTRCSLVTFPSLLGLNPDFDLHGGDVLAAVEKLEELQDKYPAVDFTQLTDLNSVQAYVESIDIFSEPYPEEAKQYSQLSWMGEQDGSYVISIPESKELRDTKKYSLFLHEKLHLRQNELDEWELSISKYEQAGGHMIPKETKLGTFSTMKEGFDTADDVLRRCRGERVKLMQRAAPWHEWAASDPAKKYLKKLAGKKNVLYCLCPGVGVAGNKCPKCGMAQGVTAGQVSQAINRLQHRS